MVHRIGVNALYLIPGGVGGTASGVKRQDSGVGQRRVVA